MQTFEHVTIHSLLKTVTYSTLALVYDFIAIVIWLKYTKVYLPAFHTPVLIKIFYYNKYTFQLAITVTLTQQG